MSFSFLERIFKRERVPSPMLPLYYRHRTPEFAVGCFAGITMLSSTEVDLVCVFAMLITIYWYRKDNRASTSHVATGAVNLPGFSKTTSATVTAQPSVIKSLHAHEQLPSHVIVDLSGMPNCSIPRVELGLHPEETVAEFLSDVAANLDRDLELREFGQTWIVTDSQGNFLSGLRSRQKRLSAVGIENGMTVIVTAKIKK